MTNSSRTPATSSGSVRDLSQSIKKMDLGLDTPPGLGSDGGQWIYTTAKTRQIGLSQAEYDNIIRGLFASSYTFRENAAPRSKADLALLETIAFEIDLEAIIEHVRHNADLPASWPIKKRVNTQVAAMVARQKSTLFCSKTEPADKPGTWSSPSVNADKDSAAIQLSYSFQSSPESGSKPALDPDLKELSSSIGKGKRSTQLSESNKTAKTPAYGNLRHNAQRDESSDSEAEALDGSSPWQHSSRLAKARADDEEAKGSSRPPTKPDLRVASVMADTLEAVLERKRAEIKEMMKQRAARDDNNIVARPISVTTSEQIVPSVDTPAHTAQSKSTKEDSVTKDNTPSKKRTIKTLGFRGRVLMKLSITHNGVPIDYYCCEHDDPDLIVRELDTKYKKTLQLDDEWKERFFKVFEHKLKKLQEK